jgi:tetratricopeptide (TPR) repeat protein
MLRHYSIASLLVLVISLYAFCEDHWGPQTENWTLANSPHHVIDDCEINSPYEITIEAGCEVYFDGFYEIRVNGGGTLLVPGTIANPVLFAANQGTQPGSWKALIADGTSQNDAIMTLTNCEIRYGGDPEAGMLVTDGVVQCIDYVVVEVTNCYIHNNCGSGISVGHNEGYDVDIDDNRIDTCAVGVKISIPDEHIEVVRNLVVACTTGMKMHTDPVFPVVNNIIKDSGEHGVYAEGSPGVFWNNVIDGTGDDGDGIHLALHASGNDDYIKNNIFANCDRYCVWVLPEFSTLVTHCCFYNYGAQTPGYNVEYNSEPSDTLERDPRLVSAYGDDNYYHLIWNSVCLGTGYTTQDYHNANDAGSPSDMGAYGGIEGTPYYVCITGGNVAGTLDQDASPYHVLADFTVGYQSETYLTLDAGTAEGVDCELLFDGGTGITVYSELNITGDEASEMVVFDRLESGEIWDGITMAVGSNGSFDWADISHADDGLYIIDASVTVDTCFVEDCTSNGIWVRYADFWMDTTIVSNNGNAGLCLYDGTAKLQRNYIHHNGAHGIYAVRYAGVRADATLPRDGYNDIVENDDVEIELVSDSKALMHEGHNNVVDQFVSPPTLLMKTSNNSPGYPRNDVELNWWGTTEDLEDRFDPADDFDWDPPDDEWNNHPAWFDPNPAWQAFAAAAELENSGRYSEAIEAYQGVVEDFPESIVALESLDRIFYVTDIIEGDFDALVDYYQAMVDTSSFAALALASNELQTRSLVKAYEFQEALDRYEAIVANPPTVYDSVYAVIGVGYVYLAAEAAGQGLDVISPVGMFPELKPASYEDYLQRCDELLAWIENYENMLAKKESAVVPERFTLMQPYPNPFNATTRISYELLEPMDVRMIIYDVLGRKVATLVDRRQDAGEYSVTWSGETSYDVPVSSGIYFVRMETETGVQSAKMLLLK